MNLSRPVWLALLGLICAAGLALRWGESRLPVQYAQADYLLLGENLVSHRLLGDNENPGAFRGVLFPAVIALTKESWSPLALPFPRWQALISAAAVPAAALLGLLLGSPLGGLLAALLTALAPSLTAAVPGYNIEPFFGLLVMAVCAALLLWEKAPDPRGALLAGACLAVSLLCRSTLFLLPPFLLAVFQSHPRLRRLRGGWWALLAAAYLPLAPWAARNLWHFGSFSPFELGAANRNFFAASLGFIENNDGYGYQDVLAGRLDTAPLAANDPIVRIGGMAWENVHSDPSAYAVSTVKRFVFSLRLHWILWLLAGLFLYRRRKEDGPWLLAAVCLYFFAVHSPMSWEVRYFDPVLPCLCVLAGGGLAEIPARLGAPSLEGGRSPLPEGMGWLARSLAVLCAALYLLGAGYLAAEAAWGLLPCRMPESPLSQLRCAGQELVRGRDREASAALERARRLEGPDTHPDLRARILIAQGLLAKTPDRALLEQAVAVSSATVRREALALQDRGRLGQAAALFDVLVARDPARRAQALVMRGTTRVLAGDKKGALEDLSRALALDPASVAAHVNLGSLLESMGRCREALSHFRSAVREAESLPEDRIPGHYLALARLYHDRLEKGQGPASCARAK
ncbi:MAG: glycosyltransferase family 39 protein [Elusimicrobia bacterium]|nr:glycosyltransferase family 39 protein [Elusimicrobiota bacterium]